MDKCAENVLTLRPSKIRMSLFLHQIWRNVSQQWMLCSEWVPSESDKNITIIHITPVHYTFNHIKIKVYFFNRSALTKNTDFAWVVLELYTYKTKDDLHEKARDFNHHKLDLISPSKHLTNKSTTFPYFKIILFLMYMDIKWLGKLCKGK